ncbi:S-methyl-5-thioribose-1-phosphate isomerase [Cobetia marina]|uniref:S-methyl-5-thioribose-1-phosphate isomerase n=1 Tax=Cobetia TaxID=204286 RepID=UPI0010AE77DB|nr:MULTISPECIES: S-methyl-5-thioribose-1-phosphate isomerase [Cobetia]MDN2655921.1 S-methyl-5-thioribose-1-phosphate isomerase [Cobetia sp. 14N.309.X.WAT.E.A4]TKD63896.1 S-methyl-5-thioribose-1-phosphate isomerase [Cobetia marina]GED40947.1 methylthioribose-1-phosphate isomerase [Cobetia marina]
MSLIPIRWLTQSDNATGSDEDALPRLALLDQRLLPGETREIELRDAGGVARAIADMVVRGAPAIGIAAAYGVALEAVRAAHEGGAWGARLEAACEVLAASRPTAVNLFWALDRMRTVIAAHAMRELAPHEALLREAVRIHEQDLEDNLRMAEFGAQVIAASLPADTPHCEVMTHCNTGALATGGHGTALGVIRTAYAQGLISRVHVNETRPWWQGARLTAWELVQEKIPARLAVEGAASLIMQSRDGDDDVRWLIVGADRIAANGDTANKIGTFSLAVQARAHGVKVMVVAPLATFDASLDSGAAIPIETRDADELRQAGNRRIAPDEIEVFNPVFDVTPHEYIDAIVTEHGVVESPDSDSVGALLGRAQRR